MDKHRLEGDRLYLIAENLAQDFSLFPAATEDVPLRGLLSPSEILRQRQQLAELDVDAYIDAVVASADDPKRTPAPKVVRQLGRVISETSDGPYFDAVVEMEFDGRWREVAFVAQDRSVKNGAWMPEHHLKAAEFIGRSSIRNRPIVSLMDTPGADPYAEANRGNQAHSISRLIVEMSNVSVPNIGIIFGLGYSGGAIPLAASNMILSVRDGVFSTIQPMGLASIARRMDLSWQECAKIVGLSAAELFSQGNIDGVIDYSPGEDGAALERLRLAIVDALTSVEQRAKEFVSENPYILDHYKSSLNRYLAPSADLQRFQSNAALRVTRSPSEYLSVFGVTYRYLRYLQVRRRIKSSSTQQYGRLSEGELPKGHLQERVELARRQAFLRWLQDPDKIVYDDTLSRSWKNYREKRQAMDDERGRIAQILFGAPRQNYEDARANLLSTFGTFLYNRWKIDAQDNFENLRGFLIAHEDTRQLLRVDDIEDPERLLGEIGVDPALLEVLRERFTYEGKKLVDGAQGGDRSPAMLGAQLAGELNLALTGGALPLDTVELSEELSSTLAGLRSGGASDIALNRALLNGYFPSLAAAAPSEAGDQPDADDPNDATVLDVLLEDDLREDFIKECENLLLFDGVVDNTIAQLDTIAQEAGETQVLRKSSVADLLSSSLDQAMQRLAADTDESSTPLKIQFFDWYLRLLNLPKVNLFFRAVEEWKKGAFPELSDTLFTVVTFYFENLVGGYLQSEQPEGKKYDGRISPRNIGRKKDFWNRLDIAYRDLRIQNLLNDYKRSTPIGYRRLIETFFTDFQERDNDLISSDPRRFPGFRVSIEGAINKDLPPCGIVTGIGRFADGAEGVTVGVAVSNVQFQAGAFDMASAEKFCRLLVECASQHLPVVCFISSGGMQTKEGAGALFSMAAVNDRITRFVRDHDLPVIVFGYGDCTGGAQASFVTHPLAQTYYFSGTNMPFAGQIVVPQNLPSTSTLSNYLSEVDGAMAGLVRHPFLPELDGGLREIDPQVPIADETVQEVVVRVLAGTLRRERSQVEPRRARFSERELIRPTKRTLIHARGCTAAKLVRIAQREGIEVVLVQSDPDMDSAVVDSLTDRDTLVCIGGNTPDESYLNALSVIRVAEQEGIDSLHPGIGFLSENSQFAELCRSRGINFIGPPVSSMETMGNKSNAINTALRLGVPVVPGSHGILTSVERAAEVAEEIGYPVLIKAVHGGGGKGIQVVESAATFPELFHRVVMEARSAFGNGDVYLEKFVTSLRHIEVQLLRDTHGNTKVLGLRDCSVQRDKQKIIEESDSTALPELLKRSVLAHTAALADEVDYVGAGTVEFIYDLANDAVYFMEMNTRLQVEHPVTEMVSGVDIVAHQFRVASGADIADLEIGEDGYAIEARINAEKVVRGPDGELVFRPDPGEVLECVFPTEDGIDVIASVSEGKFISPYYDSMVAQVIAHAPTRIAATEKLLDYLRRVRIKGICTNLPLLYRILGDQVFRDGVYDTGYLPDLFARIDVDDLVEEIQENGGSARAAIDSDSIRIENSDELKVLSPTTGIFYITPSPSEPEFVAVGDRVSADQTLCQLEAMKIFTPLALKDFGELYGGGEYEVTRINISTGQQVSPGDLLFVVKPVAVAAEVAA
ncbi:MAG: biotin carboxylase N-terminal domain-containing protein [Pseudomonadota bacterium]